MIFDLILEIFDFKKIIHGRMILLLDTWMDRKHLFIRGSLTCKPHDSK